MAFKYLNEIRKRRGLKTSERLFLFILADMCNEEGEGYFSAFKIAEEMEISDRQVRQISKDCQKKGFIKITPQVGKPNLFKLLGMKSGSEVKDSGYEVEFIGGMKSGSEVEGSGYEVEFIGGMKSGSGGGMKPASYKPFSKPFNKPHAADSFFDFDFSSVLLSSGDRQIVSRVVDGFQGNYPKTVEGLILDLFNMVLVDGQLLAVRRLFREFGEAATVAAICICSEKSKTGLNFTFIRKTIAKFDGIEPSSRTVVKKEEETSHVRKITLLNP